MAPSPLVFLASAGLLGLVAAGTGAIVAQQHSPFSHPRRAGGPFTMRDLDGRTVTEADLKGRPTAVFFGFTHCPEVCPTTLATLSGALAKMGRDADRLNVAFVTLDPERDTPEVLRDYLGAFDPRIRALVGTPAEVARMADAYHVHYRRVPGTGGDYAIDHSADVSLFDRNGRKVGQIGYGEDEARMLAKLITLAFPGQCHPGGGVSLWDGTSDGTCRSS
ncbi:SCO family protein [Methylobacterium sp. NEAU 140]|uniref:SCO family protein n=1 Tax=Methylobacterium sp. NEAU 140 TaxID=3064945 RepID=UPI0027370391|nr:SCO family protein [Methylobacterium sp. NEAU 140]MDP4023044.1 SCO family protein [Methylobacterium sp. NEAU 140]